MRTEALLRLRFSGVSSPNSGSRWSRRMEAVHEQRVAELRHQLDAGEFDDPFHRMTVEYGLGFNEWARDWCRTRPTAAGEGLSIPRISSRSGRYLSICRYRSAAVAEIICR